MSLNLGMNLISYQCVCAGKSLYHRQHIYCALVVVRQTSVNLIKIHYRSGKHLHCIAALTSLNQFDSSNSSRCLLTVRTLNRLLHLLDNIGHLTLGVAMLEIPTSH